jgi:site-specific DNA recombinase
MRIASSRGGLYPQARPGPPGPPMRVALYARVSTERQEQQGTIASQLDALRRFAAAHEHEVVDAYICVDDGYSGTRLDRPGLDRLRDGAEAGAFEAALVLCPDRLARKYAYQVLILEELERFGVRVVFLEQPPGDDPMPASSRRSKGLSLSTSA